ncbi:MAG: hypothetical protein Kow0059_17370 [Candidatus Sumerlaeia bacterium]
MAHHSEYTCRSCGKAVDPDVNYCPYCGAHQGEAHINHREAVQAFCQGNYETALRKMEMAVALSPERAQLWKDLGHCHLHAGDSAAALSNYERALELGRRYPDAEFNRAVLLMKNNALDRAQAAFQSAIDQEPLIVPGEYYLGLFFDSTSSFIAECYLYEGIIARELNALDEALGCFDKALAYNPRLITAIKGIADIHLQRKNFVQALEHYHHVLELHPIGDDLVEVRCNMGIAYFENEQLDEAVSEFRWVLQHDVGNTRAVKYLNRIYEKSGKSDSNVRHAPIPAIVPDVASPIFDLSPGDEPHVAESPFTHPPQIVIIGKSQEMLRVMRHARLAAASDSTVLITGENGTGKELLARLIYHNSPRRSQPFVVVNCAAIPETLLESELFGHEKGAFTGAYQKKIGRFEQADRGTIFLDEVAELTPMMQVKLLRVLQEKEFTRVGGTEPIRVDVRIIAATNRQLKQLIESGQFREDLYFRLNVLPIHIPPLRQRREDIPLLVNYLFRKYSRHNPKAQMKLSDEDLKILMEHDWPGNVRELENMIERSIVMGTQIGTFLEELTRLKQAAHRDDGQASGGKGRSAGGTSLPELPYSENLTLQEVERLHIIRVLNAVRGNQRRAAAILGINPTTLWRKMKQYGIKSAGETVSQSR